MLKIYILWDNLLFISDKPPFLSWVLFPSFRLVELLGVALNIYLVVSLV